MDKKEFTVVVTVKVTASTAEWAQTLVLDVLAGNDDIVDVDSCREALDLDSIKIETKEDE